MPSIITRMIVLPGMHKPPYTILLAKDAHTLSVQPRQPHRVTVLRLRDGRIREIAFVATESELAAVF